MTTHCRSQPAHWVGGIPVGDPTAYGITDWLFTCASLTPESELEDDLHAQLHNASLETACITDTMIEAVQVVDIALERCRKNNR